MREYKYKNIKIKEKEINSITCNKCKKKFKKKNIEFSPITEFKFDFGYGSKRDGEEIYFDLCDECVDEFINSFKIKPKIKNNI